MARLEDIVGQIKAYHPAADCALVERAYDFAAEAHKGQTRRSGDPFVSHPLAVAQIITELKLDVASVCAGLLHDAVEDTSTTVEELTGSFGQEIAFLVDGVTKLGKLPFSTKEERQAENFRKMLLAMARDLRVILVKFCDRLDNMRTLSHLPAQKQERIATETMQIYAPLANRLGIQWMKCELEDLSFRYLYPEEHDQIRNAIATTARERSRVIGEIEKLIQTEMIRGGADCEVTGRAKHLWSIRQKMRRTGRDFEEIHDKIGFRVIAKSVPACYQALGVAHSTWTPIPGRFKDYIALPKPNMYQSLHTAVIGPKGDRIEIQIRTDEMHLIAEQGIAAHWKYKEGKPAVASGDEKKLTWLRQMMESQQDLKDPAEFMESVKIDLFGDEVYVFTPQGDVKALPKGSCPIDFAYAIHTSVGDHCSGARVNGVIVPLRYQLRNGDTVEIITSPNQKPNKDWLKLVKMARARTKIRHRLRKEQRERAGTLGKDLVERALKKWGVSMAKAERAGDLQRAAETLKCGRVEQLLTEVGYGKITATQVAEAVVPPDKRKGGKEVDAEEKENPLTRILRRVTGRTSSSGIRVEGEDDVMVRFARCCSPLPGDKVVGFITRGRGVTVHTRDCHKALDVDPDRRIDVEWTSDGKTTHDVAIQIVCADKPGLLAHISQAFTDSGVNISQAHCRATEDRRAVNTFHASVTDLEQLKAVMRSLQRIKGVYSVDRVQTQA
jgi:GTP pyrophosphokinase